MHLLSINLYSLMNYVSIKTVYARSGSVRTFTRLHTYRVQKLGCGDGIVTATSSLTSDCTLGDERALSSTKLLASCVLVV